MQYPRSSAAQTVQDLKIYNVFYCLDNKIDRIYNCFIKIRGEKMKKIKFSIILPVYNCQKYIKKCINSVLNQTYSDFELIIIDDGSTDKSLSIMQKMAKADPRIKLIHQDNTGVALARKRAIEEATGDYTTFIDSDDEYLPDYLKTMYDLISDTGAQIVQVSYFEKYGPYYNPKKLHDISFTHEEFVNKYAFELIMGSATIAHSLWGKSYKTSIIKNAVENQEKNLTIGEDTYLNLLAFDQDEAELFVGTSEINYIYRQQSGVSSINNRECFLNNLYHSKEVMLEYMKEKNYPNIPNIEYGEYTDNVLIIEGYFISVFENNISKKKKLMIFNRFFESDIVIKTRSFFGKHSNFPESKALIESTPEQYFKYISGKYKEQSLLIRIKSKLFISLNRLLSIIQ